MSAASKAVFLSYASQDTEAARKICEALRKAGVEVWFDQNELRGGDAWDAKIRKQIKECALFVPIISANTQVRREGYFRREWKSAVDRTHDMDEGLPFLVPVVIDVTSDAEAFVPEKFREVQWTRLVLTETPVAFADRMKMLLAAESGAGASPVISKPRQPDREAVSTSSRPRARREAQGPEPVAGAARTTPSRKNEDRKLGWGWHWWMMFPIGGMIVALFGALRPYFSPSRPHEIKSGVQATPAPVATSEARQLVARAKALYEPWDGATREDFALAEQFLKRALALDATDGEVWAAYGLLTCGQIILGHDSSAARIEIARTAAERAIKLAPDSNQAQFAQAFYFRFQASTRGEAERMLRELVERGPDDRLILRTHASVLRSQKKFDEALRFFDRAAALPGGDPVAAYGKFLTLSTALRYAEAEAVIDQAIAQRPMPYLYRAKATCLTMFHGDLDRAAEMIAKVPAAYLLEDTGAWWASQIWLWRRNADKCLAVWRAVPRDLIEAAEFRGPKAFIVGQAQQLAGRSAAARAEWNAALRIVEQQLAAQPNALQWVYWKARLLALIERPVEAEAALRTFEQLRGVKGLIDDTIPIYLLLGRRTEVLDALEKGHASVVARENAGLLASHVNNLRFNPEWDLLREDPRFTRLIGGAKSPLP